jgi:hypothetical protein
MFEAKEDIVNVIAGIAVSRPAGKRSCMIRSSHRRGRWAIMGQLSSRDSANS